MHLVLRSYIALRWLCSDTWSGDHATHMMHMRIVEYFGTISFWRYIIQISPVHVTAAKVVTVHTISERCPQHGDEVWNAPKTSKSPASCGTRTEFPFFYSSTRMVNRRRRASTIWTSYGGYTNMCMHPKDGHHCMCTGGHGTKTQN